jgi:hypothetical protein
MGAAMRFLKSLKVFKGNKYEFYISFPIVFVGVCSGAHRPADFNGTIIMASAMLLGLVCAFNAVLDHSRMNIVEFGFAVIWFAVLIYFAPYVLHEAFSIRAFADR